mmetsp:Transcript_12072/g.37778  ORF Transcript_12072/g.37778 Transcript_12072/m.37778 type:complete len:242 (+) Transcript_12072:918-1643(+)
MREGWAEALAELSDGTLFLALKHLCDLLQVLPRELAEREVHEHVRQALQVASARLRHAPLRMDRHVAVRASDLGVLTFADVTGAAWLRKAHGHGVVHELQAWHSPLILRALQPQHQVLWLQVTVTDVVPVHVVDGADHLLHHDRSLGFSEVARLDNAIKELTAGAQLHDQVDGVLILVSLIELDDARVIHHLHDLDLQMEAFETLLRLRGHRLRDHLDCPDGSCGPVRRLANGAIGSRADL